MISSSEPPIVCYIAQQPGVYKAYFDEQIMCAIKGVVENGLSIPRAALEYMVPKSTLGEGRVLSGVRLETTNCNIIESSVLFTTF